MADIAYGPDPDPRLNPANTGEAYLLLVRRRLYSTILIVLFVALLASGFRLSHRPGPQRR